MCISMYMCSFFTGSVGIAAVAVAIVVVLVLGGVVVMVYWKRHMVSCGPLHVQVCARKPVT